MRWQRCHESTDPTVEEFCIGGMFSGQQMASHWMMELCVHMLLTDLLICLCRDVIRETDGYAQLFLCVSATVMFVCTYNCTGRHLARRHALFVFPSAPFHCRLSPRRVYYSFLKVDFEAQRKVLYVFPRLPSTRSLNVWMAGCTTAMAEPEANCRMFTLRRGTGLIITAGHGHIKGLRKRANTLLKYHRQHACKPLSYCTKHKRQTPAPPSNKHQRWHYTKILPKRHRDAVWSPFVFQGIFTFSNRNSCICRHKPWPTVPPDLPDHVSIAKSEDSHGWVEGPILFFFSSRSWKCLWLARFLSNVNQSSSLSCDYL